MNGVTGMYDNDRKQDEEKDFLTEIRTDLFWIVAGMILNDLFHIVVDYIH